MAAPILPILALSGGLVMIASQSKAGKADKQVTDAMGAAVSGALARGDHESAFRGAVESGDAKLVKKTKDALRKAGLHSMADSIERSAKQRKEAKQKAKAKSKNAAKKKDWQEAISSALASKSSSAVRDVMRALERAGKKKDAQRLWEAFQRLTKEAVSETAADTRNRVPLTPVAERNSEPKVKLEPKPDVKSKPGSKLPKPLPKASLDSPARDRALKLVKALKSSKRYAKDEPRALVRAYEEENKLAVDDGLYGRQIAMHLWTKYKIVPPNPYYWPRSGTAAAVKEYDRFLVGIQEQSPAKAGQVAELRATLGK